MRRKTRKLAILTRLLHARGGGFYVDSACPYNRGKGVLARAVARSGTLSPAWRLSARGDSSFGDEFRAQSDERGAA